MVAPFYTQLIIQCAFVGSILAEGSDWVTVGGDFEHTGFKADSLGPVNGIEVAWTSNLGPSLLEVQYRRVLIYNSKLYYVDPEGKLYILDALSGTLENQVTIISPSSTQTLNNPVIDPESGILFVSQSITNVLRGVGLTGWSESQIWATSNPGIAWASDLAVSSKLKRLYVADSGNFQMHALDVDTGAVQQNFGRSDPPNGPQQLSVTQETRIFAFTYNSLFAEYSAVDGSMLWNLTLPEAERSLVGPAISGNLALVRNGPNVSAIDINSQQIKWTNSAEECSLFDIATDHQYVYQSCTLNIYKYEIDSGKFVYKSSRANDALFGKPIILEDHIIAPAQFGFAVFDKSTGQIEAAYENPSPIFGNWAYFKGHIYAVDSKNRILAFRTTYLETTTTTTTTKMETTPAAPTSTTNPATTSTYSSAIDSRASLTSSILPLAVVVLLFASM